MRILAAVLLAASLASAGELPIQEGCGGGDESPPAVNPPGKYSKFPVEVEGATGMNAYLFSPEGVQPGRRYPLLYVFHGNGDGAEGRHRNLSNVSSKDYPVFVIACQYQKEAKMGSEGWGPEVTRNAFRWLLDKTLKEQPVDPDQVYLQGFSMGAGVIGQWAYRWFKDEPESMPFRGLFFNGGMASAHRKEVYPDVPYVCMVGEKETAVLGSINVVQGVREFANELLRFGLRCEYHEIPGMEHSVNERCHKVIRDSMIALAGPNDPPTPAEPGELASVVRKLKAGRWKDAMDELKPLEAKETEEKLRKRAIELRKAVEKWAPVELKRLEGRLAEGLAKKKPFDVESWARMRAVADAFPDGAKPWADKLRGLEKKQGDEIARRAKFLEARALETGDRTAAKAAYEELAKAKDSRMARAAAYRLSWWLDEIPGVK